MSRPARDYAVSIGAIVEGLASQVDALVHHILPNAVQDGNEWFVGSLAGERGRSMAVNRAGRAGVWEDFAAKQNGDALDLVAQVLFRGDKVEAIKWAKSWLGLDSQDPGRLKIYRREAEQRAKKRAAEDEETQAKMRDAAGRIFRGAAHRIQGTLVDTYLVGRGIDLAAIGRQPGVLAFSERCWCKEVNGPLPAMVAEMRRGREFVGIHRTWLEQLSGGTVAKARLKEAKKTLGQFKGGCIPLWRGADPRKWSDLWKDVEQPDEVIVLAEGIENALSVVVADASFRVAATATIGNMAAVELPDCVKTVIIARDNDQEGSKADLAFGKAVDAHVARGRIVREARAPAPHKDFNDWLRALRAEQDFHAGGRA